MGRALLVEKVVRIAGVRLQQLGDGDLPLARGRAQTRGDGLQHRVRRDEAALEGVVDEQALGDEQARIGAAMLLQHLVRDEGAHVLPLQHALQVEGHQRLERPLRQDAPVDRHEDVVRREGRERARNAVREGRAGGRRLQQQGLGRHAVGRVGVAGAARSADEQHRPQVQESQHRSHRHAHIQFSPMKFRNPVRLFRPTPKHPGNADWIRQAAPRRRRRSGTR